MPGKAIENKIFNTINVALTSGPAIAILTSSFIENGKFLPERIAPYGIKVIKSSLYPSFRPIKECPISCNKTAKIEHKNNENLPKMSIKIPKTTNDQ